MKPGIKSTELYVALASQVVALLVLTGVISTGDKDAMTDVATKIVVGSIAAVQGIAYIWGRVKLKSQQIAKGP